MIKAEATENLGNEKLSRNKHNTVSDGDMLQATASLTKLTKINR